MRRIVGTAGIIIAMSVSFSPCLLFLRHMINIALSLWRVLSERRRRAFLGRTGEPHALTQARDPGVGSRYRFADAGNSPAHPDGIVGCEPCRHRLEAGHELAPIIAATKFEPDELGAGGVAGLRSVPKTVGERGRRRALQALQELRAQIRVLEIVGGEAGSKAQKLAVQAGLHALRREGAGFHVLSRVTNDQDGPIANGNDHIVQLPPGELSPLQPGDIVFGLRNRIINSGRIGHLLTFGLKNGLVQIQGFGNLLGAMVVGTAVSFNKSKLMHD
jgi:hypothetical protein